MKALAFPLLDLPNQILTKFWVEAIPGKPGTQEAQPLPYSSWLHFCYSFGCWEELGMPPVSSQWSSPLVLGLSMRLPLVLSPDVQEPLRTDIGELPSAVQGLCKWKAPTSPCSWGVLALVSLELFSSPFSKQASLPPNHWPQIKPFYSFPQPPRSLAQVGLREFIDVWGPL